MDESKEERLSRARELAASAASKGDALGWFDELYREAAGDNTLIPWADLEPNRFFRSWAEDKSLAGNGRTALVVGCGLGDDALYLHELGFKVTAFDISATAIEWARRLHHDKDIRYQVMDLFTPFRGWLGAFEFVLEVYTIQPLPMEMRDRTMDALSAFVAPGGTLVVVSRGRDDDALPKEMPWPVSRAELQRFEKNGLTQVNFVVLPPDEEGEPERFVVEYKRA